MAVALIASNRLCLCVTLFDNVCVLQAPANHHVVLKFEDDFGVYCHNDKQCYHWVEVRHGKDIGLQGPR